MQERHQLYTCTIFHRKRKVILRDSFKVIAKPLRDFKKMFQLADGKKEAIPYDYYTVDNIFYDDEMVDIDEVKQYFRIESDKEECEKILEDKYGTDDYNFDVDMVDRTFNPVQYYCHYHKHDCLTLVRGLLKFRERIKLFTQETLGGVEGLDILTFVTLSSFADYYFQLNCCYMGCYKLQSNNRSFVQEAITGGVRMLCKSDICQESNHNGGY